MRAHGLTEPEVESAIDDPRRGTYEPAQRDRREHFGFAADGRPMNVVTNRTNRRHHHRDAVKDEPMQTPIQVRIDLEVGAGYVRYRSLAEGVRIASSVRLSEDVVVDYDRDRKVIGIELISVISPAIATAKAFAARNDLSFPDLEGTSPAKTAHR
jgi:uncharacterized protein YuzE